MGANKYIQVKTHKLFEGCFSILKERGIVGEHTMNMFTNVI